MADTTTITYSFTLPEIGASEDTWGAKLNANWTALDGLLDGTTAIAPNLVGWEVSGVAVTSTAAELNLLDGVTATTAELNILDGVTATASELNTLDGITATVAELNILDGVTATTAELNFSDGVTSNIQTQLDAKAPDNELTQVEVEDDTSTVFGQVSGQRLSQSIEANLNVTGTAPMYACRAWVSFNGTGTVAITGSGNVSSVTDNGGGDYTVNFTTAMSDANFACVVSAGGAEFLYSPEILARTASSVRIKTNKDGTGSGGFDTSEINVAIFR